MASIWIPRGEREGTTLKTYESLTESMENESKDKVDDEESSQQKKTHDTLQPNFSPKETMEMRLPWEIRLPLVG